MFNKKTKQLATTLKKGKEIFVSFLIFFLFLFAAFIPTGTVFAQQIGKIQPEQITTCPLNQRFRDWDIFISAVLSYEGFLEYWKDIFSRNVCHQADIDALISKIDKVLGQIRDSFYVCDYNKIDSLRRLYYDLEVELMYVRSVVETDLELYGWFKDINQPIAEREVYNKLHEYFVLRKAWYSKESFDTLYKKLQAKYKDRIPLYKECEDATWLELSERWNRFVSTLAGIAPATENLKTAVEKKVSKILRSPPGKVGQYLGGTFGILLNQREPKKVLAEIFAELQKNLPTGVTFSDIQAGIAQEENRFAASLEEVDMLARYQSLYRDSSDEAVKQMVLKVRKLNQTVQDTLPVLNSVAQCAATVSAKQCAK